MFLNLIKVEKASSLVFKKYIQENWVWSSMHNIKYQRQVIIEIGEAPQRSVCINWKCFTARNWDTRTRSQWLVANWQELQN